MNFPPSHGRDRVRSFVYVRLFVDMCVCVCVLRVGHVYPVGASLLTRVSVPGK